MKNLFVTRFFVFVFIWIQAAIGIGFNSSASIKTAIEPCIFETCKCSLDSSNPSISIECTNSNQSLATPNYFPKRVGFAAGVNVSDFVINNYDFAQIPDNAFEGLSIHSLALVTNNMSIDKLKACLL